MSKSNFPLVALVLVVMRSTGMEFDPTVGGHTTTFLAGSNQWETNGDVLMVMEAPRKEGMVIEPTTPAEQGYIHFYSSVVKFNESDYRIYYFSKGAAGYHSHVAVGSTPTGPWTKPKLGLFEFQNSTDNNIISLSIIVSVFVDDAPGVAPESKIKAVVGNGPIGQIISSPDGYHWSPSGGIPVGWDHFCDTQPIVFWDPTSQQYIASGRIDGDESDTSQCLSHAYTGAKLGVGSSASRSIGIAHASNLSAGVFASVHTALTKTVDDSPCLDLYTNQMVRYEDMLLVFPSAYYHFPSTDPPNAPNKSAGKGNDGVLAVRLAYSVDGGNSFTYVGAAQDTAPNSEWIPRGRGTFNAELWRFEGDWDAGHVFMTRGLLQAQISSNTAEWDTVVAYHHGSQLTHGGVDEWFAPGYHNATITNPILSGIGQISFRRDGFASLRLAAGVAVANVTTQPIILPTCRSGPRELLVLLINAAVAVNGGLRIALNHSKFSLTTADYWVGDSVRAPASWSEGQTNLNTLGGQTVTVEFHMVHDVRLYAYEFRCVGV
eukprot:m.98847 g.98847  ORF g.98847 m.98847 type:complete len:545 (+) comp27106_c0_seq2:119-1753(+)